MIGRITFWNNIRGFGFITTPTGEQHFFHITNFERNSQPVLSATVSFELGDPIKEGKKPQAVGVKFATASEIVIHALAGGAQ